MPRLAPGDARVCVWLFRTATTEYELRPQTDVGTRWPITTRNYSVGFLFLFTVFTEYIIVNG